MFGDLGIQGGMGRITKDNAEDNRGQDKTITNNRRQQRSRQISRENVGAPKAVVLLVDLFTEWTFFWLSCVTVCYLPVWRPFSACFHSIPP